MNSVHLTSHNQVNISLVSENDETHNRKQIANALATKTTELANNLQISNKETQNEDYKTRPDENSGESNDDEEEEEDGEDEDDTEADSNI